MSDGKVFSKETKDLLVKVGDEAIKLPFYAEMFDGPALKIAINWIDGKADKFIPDTIDPLINATITAALAGRLDEAALHVGNALNQVIDIPLLDEDEEQRLLVDAVRVVLRLIDTWVQGKIKAEDAE